jgi:tetratricopeptide (TPR) repeat protein
MESSGGGALCTRAEDMAAYITGELPDPDVRELEIHAADCNACRELLSALVRLTEPADAGLVESASSIDNTSVSGAAPERPLSLVGSTIGRYEILEQIGVGGMGVVHAAYDPQLKRRVALKILRDDLLAADVRSAMHERLLREAQAMAQLAHTNVVAVYEVDRHDERVFIAMELVKGETVDAWLAVQPRSWREIVSVFVAAGQGLAAAHAAGLVHRDFKPANVLIGRDGRARVTDFGLAHATLAPPGLGGSADLHADRDVACNRVTKTGALVGTPLYMAPEQLRGEPADVRSDQFSFCVALFISLYGVPPFEGDTFGALAANVHAGRVREVLAKPRVPRQIRDAILRGLAVEPAERFASLDELLAVLTPPRHRGRWALGLAAVLVAIGGLAVRSLTEMSDQRCTGAASVFASAWNAERRTALETTFARAPLQYATAAAQGVVGALDRYAVDWTAAHTEACRATRIRGEQTEVMLDMRMVCLERRRQAAAALVDTLVSADAAGITRSVEAALALPDVAICSDIAALQQIAAPPNPFVRARLAALTPRLADARAKLGTGSFTAGLAIARAVTDEARALSYWPFEGEAALLQGELESQAGDPKRAEATLLTAVWAAEAGRHDEITARAWIELVFVVGRSQADYERGVALAPRVTAALARLGGNSDIEAKLEMALGAIEATRSRLDAAVAHFEKALALEDRTVGPDHPNVARVLDGLGNAVMRQGDGKRAVDVLERARGIVERAFGPDHPRVARALCVLGNAYVIVGKAAHGEQLQRRALAIRRAALGDAHPDTVANLLDLGRTVRTQGRVAEALALDLKTTPLAERAFGAEHPSFAKMLMGLGISFEANHRYAEAELALRRAEAIFIKLYGPSHDMVTWVRYALASLAISQSHWQEAVSLFEPLIPAFEKGQENFVALQEARAKLALAHVELHRPERALAILEPIVARVSTLPPGSRGDLNFVLARALWDSHRDRKRALELAAAARLELESTRQTDELAKLDRWLATITRRRSSRSPRASASARGSRRAESNLHRGSRYSSARSGSAGER